MKPIGTLLLLVSLAASAQDRRITLITVQRKQALIIGNSAYSTAPLKNPTNDAAAVEAALHKLGFEVRTLGNLDLPHMEAAIDEFAAGLSSGSLAFFYYSGHGLQVNYTNYLLPVDFAASSEIDVKYKAYPATRVQEKMEASGARLRILVLDACRNNPFRFKRDAQGGLASMPVNAEGTLVAFATGDNNTADDNRAEANGLYTKFLIPALQAPGLQLREAFQKAKEDVFAASQKAQNPSIYENIVGSYYLVSAPQSPAGGTQPARLDAAAETWALIKNSSSPEDFESFAQAFPNSDLASGARIRAAQLRRNTVLAAPPADAPRIPAMTQVQTKMNSRDGLIYVWIPPGRFTMGCSPGDGECEKDEKPAHEVTLTKGFWLGQTPVTQQAYQHVIGKNPSHFKGSTLPVETVNWNEAQAYCGAIGGRLPTEAEWEYSARAGSTGSRYGDIDDIAWHKGNSGNGTHAVGEKLGNNFGLYDMLGNVRQWVGGRYANYDSVASVDPVSPGGLPSAVRGSGWSGTPGFVRVSVRRGFPPGVVGDGIGFRCAGGSL